MKQVYVIHGYTASASAHWFPYLAQQLSQTDIACTCLNMPNPMQPDTAEWLVYLKQQLQLTKQTVIIGHSLGCIAALNLLLSQQQPILSGIFVSGFNQSIPHLAKLNPFVDTYQALLAQSKLNPSQLFRQTPCTIAAYDDHIVPHQYTETLATALQADYIRLQRGGHFLDREGWIEFPLVLQHIQARFKNE
ncbi:RBBP9/YdeN family alpha/beta hydrolase [Pasteurella oralis]|uniref:RBBP9/YdeN family alpha/beta hydrolase n=1 Tax=Pasteurella oralis TaxID=1071947 RepID=UPI000C7A095D|nr:alpha/beta fold hydrolase [Pasteurella oralis]